LDHLLRRWQWTLAQFGPNLFPGLVDQFPPVLTPLSSCQQALVGIHRQHDDVRLSLTLDDDRLLALDHPSHQLSKVDAGFGCVHPPFHVSPLSINQFIAAAPAWKKPALSIVEEPVLEQSKTPP
jgi:hypothetical protein